jgi:hypothetical protein
MRKRLDRAVPRERTELARRMVWLIGNREGHPAGATAIVTERPRSKDRKGMATIGLASEARRPDLRVRGHRTKVATRRVVVATASATRGKVWGSMAALLSP